MALCKRRITPLHRASTPPHDQSRHCELKRAHSFFFFELQNLFRTTRKARGKFCCRLKRKLTFITATLSREQEIPAVHRVSQSVFQAPRVARVGTAATSCKATRAAAYVRRQRRSWNSRQCRATRLSSQCRTSPSAMKHARASQTRVSRLAICNCEYKFLSIRRIVQMLR